MAGEAIAEAYLRARGVEILDRRLRIGRGELDLIGVSAGEKIAIEVRSVTGWADPLDAFGPAKFDQVWRLARSIGCTRVDLVAVSMKKAWVDIRWVPGVQRG